MERPLAERRKVTEDHIPGRGPGAARECTRAQVLLQHLRGTVGYSTWQDIQREGGAYYDAYNSGTSPLRKDHVP